MTLDSLGLFRPKTLALSSRATKKEGDPFALEQVESKTNQRNEEGGRPVCPRAAQAESKTNQQRKPASTSNQRARNSLPTNLRSSQHRNGHDKQLKTMSNNAQLFAQQFGTCLVQIRRDPFEL